MIKLARNSVREWSHAWDGVQLRDDRRERCGTVVLPDVLKKRFRQKMTSFKKFLQNVRKVDRYRGVQHDLSLLAAGGENVLVGACEFLSEVSGIARFTDGAHLPKVVQFSIGIRVMMSRVKVSTRSPSTFSTRVFGSAACFSLVGGLSGSIQSL